MDKICKWLVDNFEVLFSGVGVYILSLLLGGIFLFIRNRSSQNKVTQREINAGGDVVGRDKKG